MGKVRESVSLTTTTDGQSLRYVGRRTKRSDAPERLTGKLRYVADLPMPGLLHARLVLSPYAAARIVTVNADAARAVPGVFGVYTASDLPIPEVKQAVEDRTVLLALDRVLYAGHPVAVVLAEDEATAEDAASLVEVEYDPLEPVVDMRSAGEAGTPAVRAADARATEDMSTHGGGAAGGSTQVQQQHPNVGGEVRFERGDVDKGFAEAAITKELEFSTPWVHQSYMEPKNGIAAFDPFGKLTIYASTQGQINVRDAVAKTLGLTHLDVNVHAMPVGGGFGGKVVGPEPLVAALARLSERPVRLVFNRMDEFQTARPMSPSRIRVKVGATAEGKLTSLQSHLVFDAGSSPGSPVSIAALLMGSVYPWEHLLITGNEVLTNRSANGAYRGPGAVQAQFALESLIDEVARELKIDPLDLRRKNAVKQGDPTASGKTWPRIGLAECLEQAQQLYSAEQAACGPNEGVGVAIGGWMGAMEPATAFCRLDPDGSLRIFVGSVDITGTNSTFELVAAEGFGISPDKIKVITADTDHAPHQGVSAGSKTTYSMSPAVLRAAQDAKDQVLRIAASQLEASMDDLEIVDGAVRVRGVPDKSVGLQQIYKLSTSFGGKYAAVQGRGQSVVDQQAPGFAVHLVRVHVDPETGKVTPRRYIAVQDAGKALNPANVEGQMMGAVVQAVGWGLFENIPYDERGTPLATSFLDYAVPKATQSPEIDAVIVEVPSEQGAFGARGVGEPPVIPGPAAIANAVRAASGARITDLPITPEKVQRALAPA